MAADVDAPGLVPGAVLMLRRLPDDEARWSPALLDEDEVGPVADEARMFLIIDDSGDGI